MINFELIRQYFYCKRIVYFREVRKYQGVESYKMIKGREYHEMKQKREKEKETEKWVENEKLGIGGFIDYIEEKNGEKIMGEYKQKIPEGGKINQHYKMQLIAEILAIDEKIEKVEIKIPEGKKIIEEIKEEEKTKVKQAIKEIKTIIKNEEMPDIEGESGKCTDCEYKNLCQPF